MKLARKIVILVIFACFIACKPNSHVKRSEATEDSDTLVIAAISMDESQEELNLEEEELRIDSTFSDFLFAFKQSRRFRQSRISYPLAFLDISGQLQKLNAFAKDDEFDFLDQDFYTVFYGDVSQIEHFRKNPPDSLISVEKIDLDKELIRTYSFKKIQGKWRMINVKDTHLEVSNIADFLTFYDHFSTDSLFQVKAISNPLLIYLQDPTDSNNSIKGTISPEQWYSFAPYLPRGILSNIRYGQQMSIHQMILQKCGVANGMEELLTFHRTPKGWKLTKLEN